MARIALLAALAAAHVAAAAAPAPSDTPTPVSERSLEQRVKAAFLFRFTEFVTWPEAAYPQPRSPFTIAVAGRAEFADTLRQITAGRSISGRAVEVKRVNAGESMASAQILFVPDSEKNRLREWVRAAPRHALVVTESEGALAAGSVINFVLIEGRVRFEISLESAEKRGLRMSSRLLALGVRTDGP